MAREMEGKRRGYRKLIDEESSGYSSLSGAKEDLEKLTAFLKNTYHIITIVNAQDIEARVMKAMEGLPDSCLPVTHFQLVYSGISSLI